MSEKSGDAFLMPRKYSKEEKQNYLKNILKVSKANNIPQNTFFSWFKNPNKTTTNIEFYRINLEEHINEGLTDKLKIIFNKIEVLIPKMLISKIYTM